MPRARRRQLEAASAELKHDDLGETLRRMIYMCLDDYFGRQSSAWDIEPDDD